MYVNVHLPFFFFFFGEHDSEYCHTSCDIFGSSMVIDLFPQICLLVSEWKQKPEDFLQILLLGWRSYTIITGMR